MLTLQIDPDYNESYFRDCKSVNEIVVELGISTSGYVITAGEDNNPLRILTVEVTIELN